MFPGQYYCETCYVAACGKRCAGCGQVILGEGLKFGEERCGNIMTSNITTLQQYNNTLQDVRNNISPLLQLPPRLLPLLAA